MASEKRASGPDINSDSHIPHAKRARENSGYSYAQPGQQDVNKPLANEYPAAGPAGDQTSDFHGYPQAYNPTYAQYHQAHPHNFPQNFLPNHQDFSQPQQASQPQQPSPQHSQSYLQPQQQPDQPLSQPSPTSRTAQVAQGPPKSGNSPEVDVDLVVYNLSLPECGADVAAQHCNAKTADLQVQAYAKLAGRGWTFYVQRLPTVIGRKSGAPDEVVDIDLAPSKVISRKHAVIQYNTVEREWEVVTIGRNGLKLDGEQVKADTTVRLTSGQVLDIGGVQMMFVRPDRDPVVSPYFVQRTIEAQQASQARRESELLAAQRSNSVNGSLRNDPVSQAAHPGAPIGSAGALEEDTKAYPRGVTMVTRPQVPANQFMDCDLSSEEAKDIKPPFSYATMISQAILSTPDHMMSLAGIYAWIASHYAFYRRSKPGWQNSIRHNLSLNKAFEKVARKQNEPGKGSKWHIVEKYKEELIKKATTGRQQRGVFVPKSANDAPGAVSPKHGLNSPQDANTTLQPGDHSQLAQQQFAGPPSPSNQSQEDPNEMSYARKQEVRRSMRQQKIQEERLLQERRREQVEQFKPAQNSNDTRGSFSGPSQSQEQLSHQQSQQLAPHQQQQQQQQQQQPFTPSSPYGPYAMPPPGQQPYPMQLQFPEGGQYPVQGFQYMQAFGVPYYNSQMMPQMPMYGQQVPHAPHFPPPQDQQPPQSPSKADNEQSGDQSGTQSGAQSGDQSGNQSGDQSGTQADDTTLHGGIKHESSTGASRSSGAAGESEQLNGTENQEHGLGADEGENHHSEPELKTPAKPTANDSPLGSAIKLEISQVSGAPESSPGMWKYINMESTPNNQGGASHERGPDSSPSREMSRLPVLKQGVTGE